ncbi:hypothetical protein IW261DRAFT_1422824 [Armillaria novae-zelandiae]|uniref:CxC2-like cysteine cluster KDZ transposase-associated domain-containing protein n=1 Tax=Armillaria novae-zelandiae TaxID=153914 RepID=A0AA39NZ21_9AGAR|nr:hypothetical protein IW261DRAFT_1422824 [Armillaria novae-zelandiae]
MHFPIKSNIGLQTILCSRGCPTVELFFPSPEQQAKLLNIIQEDKLARSLDGKKRAVANQQARVDKARITMLSQQEAAQRSGLHRDEAKADTLLIKYTRCKEDLAHAAHERDLSAAAFQTLAALETCTNQQGLKQYLVAQGLVDSAHGVHRHLYTSAKTRNGSVTAQARAKILPKPCPHPMLGDRLTESRSIAMQGPPSMPKTMRHLPLTPPPTRRHHKSDFLDDPDEEIVYFYSQWPKAFTDELIELSRGPTPPQKNWARDLDNEVIIVSPRLTVKRLNANVKVQSFSAGPSTFTSISGSPTKGSSLSRVLVDAVDANRRRHKEDVELVIDCGVNVGHEDPISVKHPRVERGPDIDLDAEGEGNKQTKPSKQERTFKEHYEPSCKACFVTAHLHNPWHWAKVWNGSFFDHQDISKLGHIIIIGHDRHQGVDCPYAVVKEPVDFHLKSAYDYISAIRRKTNNVFSSEALLFLQVQRIWIALTMYKWGGQVHNMDTYFPSRPTSSVVVPCFSCPERGFNVMDTIMETVSDENQCRHLVQLFLMQDGHFGLQRFHKVDDPDDMSLLPGCSFFPADEDYLPYERDVVATSDEKSTCSNFNAIEMQNKLKFRGCVVTGVIAVESKYFWRVVLTYDVACQYHVKLRKCFIDNFIDLADIIDIILCLVPKMHLDGHIEKCKYEFSLNYVKGMGRSHGEGIEASWAETKQSGGSTRQMNHGHRHDKLNDFHNYWNWAKVENMIPMQADILSSLTRHETNVAMDKAAKQAHKKESEMIHLIDVGIKLQSRQHRNELKRIAMKKDIPDDDIKNMRKTLTSDIKKFRKWQIKSLSLLETVEFAPTDNAEDDILLLPSDFDINDHKTYKLEALVKMEYKLREGQANDAIAMLCTGIIHGMVLTDSRRKHSRGVTMNLRSMKYINTVAKKKNEYAASYCQARAALLRLSGVDDLPDFPILRKEDMFSKNAAGARALGDGAMTDSWIWTYGRLRGMNKGEKQEFLMDALRVQWFRTCADTERWMEEVEILEQEF